MKKSLALLCCIMMIGLSACSSNSQQNKSNAESSGIVASSENVISEESPNQSANEQLSDEELYSNASEAISEHDYKSAYSDALILFGRENYEDCYNVLWKIPKKYQESDYDYYLHMCQIQGDWVLLYTYDEYYARINVDGTNINFYHAEENVPEASTTIDRTNPYTFSFNTSDISYECEFVYEEDNNLEPAAIKCIREKDAYFDDAHSLYFMFHDGSGAMRFLKADKTGVSITYANLSEAKSEPTIGMTKEEVLNSTWGEPNKKNISEYEWGTEEQWVYYGNKCIYFEDGIVTAIQKSE